MHARTQQVPALNIWAQPCINTYRMKLTYELYNGVEGVKEGEGGGRNVDRAREHSRAATEKYLAAEQIFIRL